MQKPSLDAMARKLGRRAATENSGRAAETIYGGHRKALRQTVVALTAGTQLGKHDSPGDATIIVINGRLKLVSGEETWEGRQGTLIAVPPERYRVEAVTDTAFLLTVAKTPAQPAPGAAAEPEPECS